MGEISRISFTNRLLALEEDGAPELMLPRQDVREGNGCRVLVHRLDGPLQAARLAIIYVLACHAAQHFRPRGGIELQYTIQLIVLNSSPRFRHITGKGAQTDKVGVFLEKDIRVTREAEGKSV